MVNRPVASVTAPTVIQKQLAAKTTTSNKLTYLFAFILFALPLKTKITSLYTNIVMIHIFNVSNACN